MKKIFMITVAAFALTAPMAYADENVSGAKAPSNILVTDRPAHKKTKAKKQERMEKNREAMQDKKAQRIKNARKKHERMEEHGESKKAQRIKNARKKHERMEKNREAMQGKNKDHRSEDRRGNVQERSKNKLRMKKAYGGRD